MLRILHVGDVAGVGYKLAALLNNSGIQAKMVTYRDIWTYNPAPWLNFFTPTYSDKSITKIVVPYECYKSSMSADLLHVHSGFGRLFLLTNKPFILHCHGSELRRMSNNPQSALMHQALKRATAVLTSTPDLNHYLARLNIKSQFLPNPIDTRIFNKNSEKIDLHEGFNYVLFHPTGHRWKIKGNDLVIKAFSRVAKAFHVRLIMISYGADLEKSIRLVHELGLDAYVRFLPFQSSENIAKYYNASDIIVDQFVVGALGQVSLEAMACQKPLICKYSDYGGYSTTPPLLSASTEQEIEHNMRLLLRDQKLASSLGKSGRDWVEQEHKSSVVLSKLVRIYNGSFN